jgi:hypothetical protein
MPEQLTHIGRTYINMETIERIFMDTIQYITLDHIIDLIGDPTDVCIDYCNTTITEKTENPFKIVVAQHHMYRTLLRAKRISSLFLPGYNKKDFKPITFQKFYHMLDRSVKDIIFSKQPTEVYCVFQNE